MKQPIIFLLCIIILSTSSLALVAPLSRQLVMPVANTTIVTAPVIKPSPIYVQPIEDDGPVVDYAQGDDGSLALTQKVNRSTTEYDEDGRFEGYDKQTDQPVIKPVGVHCSADDCTFHYDGQRRVIGVTEKTNVSNRTRIIVYDKDGSIEKELVVDNGQVPDNLLDEVQDMGSVYQEMYDLLMQGADQKKDALEEMKAAAESKLQAALESVEQQKKEIEEKTEQAKDNFAQRVWLGIKSLFMKEGVQKKIENGAARIEAGERKHEDLVKCRQTHQTQRRSATDCEGILEMQDNNHTLYFNVEGKLIGYKENHKTHIFEYNALGKIVQEIILDHETGNITGKSALEDALGNADIDYLVELVMFEIQDSEEDALREMIEEIHNMNQQKNTQREYQEHLKEQKEQVQDELQKEFYDEPASELADKLPGSMDSYAKKGVELGKGKITEPQGKIDDFINKTPEKGEGIVEKSSLLSRFWDWVVEST